MKYHWLVFMLLLLTIGVKAQVIRSDDDNTTIGAPGGQQGKVTGINPAVLTADTATGFQRRNAMEDSITISFRYLDSSRRNRIDSSVNDFDAYFTIPSVYQYMGNNGAAAYPIVYSPRLSAGWDAGFHAYDLYRFTIEQTRLYRTTRPFSSLSYQLATGKEQMIKAMHTQNPRPNINFGMDYRLITSPGLFITQNTNHNSYRIYNNYTGKRKRYAATFVMIGNTLRASENGGIQADSLLDDPNRKDRFSVPVNLGNAAQYQTNPFVTTVLTGNVYKDFNLYYRHSYDIGKRDSIAINDSTTEYLFYPRLRFQHTFTSSVQQFRFTDVFADSVRYSSWYGLHLDQRKDTVAVTEKWNVLTNDFSIIQFPDTKNVAQFISVGASYQSLKAQFKNGSNQFYNIMLHGEYRNLSRNKKWEMELKGQFYLSGLNEGDYMAYAKLDRFINKRWGDISVFFSNVSRTPSFIFNQRSSFHFDTLNVALKKENIISFGATSTTKWLTLGFKNTTYTNYTYYRDFININQASVVNVLQLSAATRFKLARHINWYTDAIIQQSDGASPIRVPLFYSRNRIAFEGNFYKNLTLSTGLEIRYHSPFKAYAYSPLNGQFVPQDSVTIKNRPDVDAFLHFRIRSFTAYIRAENLNTMSLQNGFGFTKNNFAAPLYPTPGLIIRVGIQWWFVN